jgi:hypothetical protein
VNEHHAILRAFDSVGYLATVQFGYSPDTTVSGVPVSRAIASSAMVVGSVLAVVFFDELNSADAMVVGVF